jgi:hypothetical protein
MKLHVSPLAIGVIVAAVVAWSGIAAAVLSMRNEPAPAKAETEETRANPEFNMRWDDAPALKKQDRLPLVQPDPNSVERIDVADAPARVPLVVASLDQHRLETQEGNVESVTRRRHVARDICARHGKHKVLIHGGRSWRCR